MRPKPKATPTKGALRRAEIVAKTRALLEEGGMEGLSLRKVADGLGLRLGHVQYYFPTREDLVFGVFDAILKESAERATRVFEGKATRSGVEDVVHLLLLDQKDPALARLFYEAWALASRDSTIRRSMKKFYRAFTAEVERVIATCSPGSSQRERMTRAALFVSLLEGASLFRSGVIGKADATYDASLKAQLVRLIID